MDTKEKGDLGLMAVMFDLQKQGFSICLPVSEHLGFDLIAVDKDYNISKISVKYRTMVNGAIEVPMRTISSNSKGYKVKFVDLDKINGYAIYCPDNNQCYYVPSCNLREYSNVMTLRVEPRISNRGGSKISNSANEFLDPKKLFKQ